MRKINRINDFYISATTNTPHGGGKIPGTIDGQQRGFVVRGREKRGRQMTAVMLHLMDFAAKQGHIQSGFQQRKFLIELHYLPGIFRTTPHGRYSRRRITQHKSDLFPELGFWVPPDGNMIQFRQSNSRFPQTKTHGFRGESRPVFYPAEPLFLGGSDHHAILKNGCGGVGVVGVYAENVHNAVGLWMLMFCKDDRWFL